MTNKNETRKIVLPVTLVIISVIIIITILYWRNNVSANLNNAISILNHPLFDIGKNQAKSAPVQPPVSANTMNTYPYLPPPVPVQQNERPEKPETARMNVNSPNNQIPNNDISQPLPSHQIPRYVCICPNCLSVYTKSPGVSCFTLNCPVCGTRLVEQVVSTANLSQNSQTLSTQPSQSPTNQIEAKNTPLLVAQNQPPVYESQIKEIILKDCSRCHSGPNRNLMSYDALSAYANNGILEMMVGPGGPMNRFAGNNASIIVEWIKAGTPENNIAIQAAWGMGQHQNQGACPRGPQHQQNCPPRQNAPPLTQQSPQDANSLTITPPPGQSSTYTNTIKWIIAKDCSSCHSGQMRNLMTYQNVKYYVDNGLLKQLIEPSGQMHRFAGPDSKYILDWIKAGAPK